MKLKSRSRPGLRRVPRTTRGTTPSRNGGKPRGSQAKRPGVPLRQRLGGRLPNIRRVMAGLGAAAVAAGLTALLNGPWLRVTEVTWAGEQFTASRDIERILDRQRGTSVLAIDTAALRAEIERMPSVAEATVMASLTGELAATVEESAVAFVWETARVRFLGASDGTIFAGGPVEADADPDLAALPMTELSRRRLAIAEQLSQAEAHWLHVSEQLERLAA